MRELRSGVRRGRSAATIGMVIRKKRTTTVKRKQPEPPEVETEENYSSVIVEEEPEEDERNRAPTPYEEAYEYLRRSAAAAQMALRRKRCLEKGLPTQTLLHESSNSYEIDDVTREGSVSLGAPECEVTNHNYEMYDHIHEGSVPVDIPECETAKDDVVDNNNGKHKKKEKVAPAFKAAPVVEDELCRTTRLLGKRKASGTVAEQPNVEDHLIEAPEEFESDKLHEQRKLIENESQEERLSRLQVEDQLLTTQNMVSWLEETMANILPNGKGPALTSTRAPIGNKENLEKGPASTSNRVHRNNNEIPALRTSDEMSAKKRYLEKGLPTQTFEMDNETREGSAPLAAPNCEVTKRNCEMYDHKNEGSVPVDIPEYETAKDDMAAPVAEDEMRRTTRLSVKRKASGTVAKQPNVEDHLIESPVESESESSMNRNVRRPTTLPHIAKTNTRHLKVIEYNEHGQPIGKFSSELASYMGVLARQMVPIVHKNWSKVPGTLKEELWRCLEAKYVLEASSSNFLVNGIGDKWRCFKSNLTSKYILPFKDEPDRLIHPPPKYRFIKQAHWDEFVKSRLNDAFQALHEAQSERRGKNIHPHRLGRTGYARLVDKMIKNDGITPEEIDSCVLWKKARQDKNGEYVDDVTREQAEIIDELRKQVDNGSLVCDGNIDVLTLALRTPDHTGQMRGARKLVSQSAFFRKPKRQALKIADKLVEQRKLIENKWQGERVTRSRVEDQLLNTQNMVSQLEETLAKFKQNRKSPSSISNKHLLVNCENLEKELASVSTMPPSSNSKHLGAGLASTSTMAPVNNNRNSVFQGKGPALTFTRVPLSNKENLRKGPASTSNRVHLNNNENSGKGPASTSNRVHLNSNENLGKGASTSNRVHPNNNGNLEKGPASTSNRVHLNNIETLGNSPASSSDRPNSNNYEPSTSGSSQSRVWRNDTENLPVVQVTPSKHVARSVKDSNLCPFQRFYASASQKLTGSIPFISVPVDDAVFGTDMELYLDLDDVRYVCHMEDLSENCIMVYIRHLYDILVKRGIQHKFEFINPASVSAAKDADLSKIITSRLMNTNCEWVFVPVNPEGAHWLLVAINIVAMSCYWLDPSGLPIRCNIKPFLTFGLKGLQKDGVRRSSPIWYNIKCPKQKKSVESGFYMMKFMREIIDEPNMFTRSEPFPKSTYEQDEIDEVRLEWIQTVESYI